MKKDRMERLLLSIFGSDDDKSELLVGKEEMEKKIDKIMELISADQKDDKSADALELVSLVENFHGSYQTLYGRYNHLAEKLNKYVRIKKEMNGDESDSDSSSESDSSDSEASKDEGIPVEDYELLQQANENSSENTELLMEIEGLKEELVVKDVEIQALSLKYSEAINMIKIADQKSLAVSIDFERLNKETSQLLIDHEGLKLELKAADGKIYELEKMLELMREEEHAFNVEKEYLISEKSTLLDRLDDMERSITKFVTETDTLKDKTTVLQNENTILKQEIETSNKQLSELRMQLTATVEQKDAIHSENAAFLSQIGQAEREIEALRKEDSMNLQLANEKSSEKEKMLNDIERLRINLEEANQQNIHLVQELNAAKEKNCVLESEMLNVTTQKHLAERTIEELRIGHARLEEERLKLLAFNEELVEKSSVKDTTNGKLLDKNWQLERLTDELKSEIEHSNSDLTMRLEVTEDKIFRQQSELAEARREASVEIDAAMARANDKQTELDHLRSRGFELEEHVSTLTGRLSEERTQMKRVESELKSKIADKAAIVMEQMSSFEELAANHRLVEEQLRETSTNLGMARDRIEELEKGKEKAIRRLEVVEQELKRDMGEMEEKLGEATAKVARSEAGKANAGREIEGLHGVIDALEVQLRLSNQKLEITEIEHKAKDERDGRRIDELAEESCRRQEQVASLASRTHLLETELAQTRMVLVIELTSVGNAFQDLETAFDNNCRRFRAQLAKGAEELGAAKEMSKALVSRKQKLEDEKRELSERVESARVVVLNLEEELGDLRAKLAATVEEEEELKEIAARNQKRVMELEKKVREEEEVVRQKDEEKREAIRQLCHQIDYHRENCGRFSRLLASMGRSEGLIQAQRP